MTDDADQDEFYEPIPDEAFGDDPYDQFDQGYAMCHAQVTQLVKARFDAIVNGGELRAGDVEALLREIADLGE